MDSSGICSFIILLLHAIVILQSFWTASSREMNKGYIEMNSMHHHHHSSSDSKPDLNDPELQIFFRFDDLKLGKILPIYFPIKDFSTAPPLLSREEADSIFFSSAHFPELLEQFSISEGSPQAEAIRTTLRHCEFEPMKGESKFCATSLESLLDSTRAIFGPRTEFKVATTNHLTKNSTSLLQNYTIVDNPREISVPRIVGCHPLPYPYSVFYCHSQQSDNKLFRVSLKGENEWRIEALGICHMDTSQWDSDHVAFLVLNTQPGKSPVCHFFPADNLVWFPSEYETV